MTRRLPWVLAALHAALLLGVLAQRPVEPAPGALGLDAWHRTSIMVAGRDLHHSGLALALFVLDLPVCLIIGLAVMPFERTAPVTGSYFIAILWLILGSLWWFVLGRLVIRRRSG